MTSTTVVTREPEWNDEQREIAFEKHDFDQQVCPGCGGHYSQTLDEHIARDVEHEKFQCLDCKAIDEVRAKHHKKHGDHEGACDCDTFATYVKKYVPLPPSTP